MIKRVLGWLLFAWMLAVLVGLAGGIGGKTGTMFWMDIGIAAAAAAIGVIGLLLGMGKGKAASTSKNPRR